MYPNAVIGKNITLRYLMPTLQNAARLSHLVHDNATYLSPVFHQMVQAYETPMKILTCLKYDEECYLRNQMLPYYIFKNDALIGEITADWQDKEGITQIIYWMDKNYIGKGYTSEALKLMEKTLFGMGHKEIRLYIDAINLRSAAVAQKAGYQLSYCTNYYFKTLNMYRDNYRKICRHKDVVEYKKYQNEFLR